MSRRGFRSAAADDFDGYDPAPYTGGYSITLTYGRPLQPSPEICYPVSGTQNVDFNRPHHSPGSPSGYSFNVPKGDCYSIPRPNQHPAYSFPPQPQPETNAGYAGSDYRNYGREGVGVGGTGFSGVFDYESGQVQPPHIQDYGSCNYGSGYYGHPQRQERGRENGSEHRSSVYGYPRREEEGCGRQGYGGSEYRRSEEEAAAAAAAATGYRRHGDYSYDRNLSYERPNYGVPREQSRGNLNLGYEDGVARQEDGRGDWNLGYGNRGVYQEHSGVNWNLGYGKEGSGMYKQFSYGGEEQRTGYMKPGIYGGKEGREEYGSSKYGNDSDEEKKHHYQKHHHHHH